MKVKDIDFKKLQKENEKYTSSVLLTFDEGMRRTAKQFDSFTAVNNYLTSHPRWNEYADSDCELRHEETWNNRANRVGKQYFLTIYLKKKDTPKIPYYQFCNGNCINVNGKTYAPEIKDVIFNPPATIVKWADGTKTVVKANGGDAYDPEVGLAMAISKKMYGNNYSYYNVFKKWLKKFDDNAAKKALRKVAKATVCAASNPNPASERLRELEEINLNFKKLTGCDSKELLGLFAYGDNSINLVGTNSILTLANALKEFEQEKQEKINCKDCAHFTPLPGNDPWEDDGVCELDGKGTYGMNSCDKAETKD